MKNIPWLAHVAAISIFVPAAFGIVSWKKLEFPLKIFALLCVYSVAHLVMEFIMGRLGTSNQFLSNIHQLIEFGCLSYLYYARINEKYFRQTIQTAVIFYVIFWVYNVFYFNDPNSFNEMISMVASIILILMSVTVLTFVFKTTLTVISHSAVFWIAAGAVIYFSGTIAIFTMSNTILAMGMPYFNLLWHINWTMAIITNMMYARSFTCKIL